MEKSRPHSSSILSRRLFLAGGSACMLSTMLNLRFPALAHADELGDSLDQYQVLAEQIKDLKQELEEASNEYYKTKTLYSAAKAQVDASQAAIDGNTRDLKKLQARLTERIKAMYRGTEIRAIDLLMGSVSFTDFATKWDLIERMNDGDAALAAQVRALREKNEEEKEELEASKKKAEERFKEAEVIQTAALEKMTELETLYDGLSEELKVLLGLDQLASLANEEDVLIIGNPRDIPPHPEVVEFAESRIGCPYIWAAAGPDAFDCSGLVVWCFDKAGISGLPHYTESLYRLALHVGAVVPLEDVEPGDVLYRPGHVGIASGSGGRPFVHAPCAGAYVRDTDSLAYCGFVCGLRFPGAGTLSLDELAAALTEVEAEIAAEEEAKRAEEEAKEEQEREEQEAREKEAEEERRREEAARAKAEEQAREQANEEARAQAEAEKEARRQAEAEAKEKARAEAEEQARIEAEKKVQAEAEEKARKEAEERARAEAEEQARIEAEEEARRQAEAAAEASASSSSKQL